MNRISIIAILILGGCSAASPDLAPEPEAATEETPAVGPLRNEQTLMENPLFWMWIMNNGRLVAPPSTGVSPLRVAPAPIKANPSPHPRPIAVAPKPSYKAPSFRPASRPASRPMGRR